MLLRAAIASALAIGLGFTANVVAMDTNTSAEPTDPNSQAACEQAARTTIGGQDYCDARALWMQERYAQAERKLLRSASIGNDSAQYLLGLAYFNGDGVKADPATGLAWLAMAAKSGNTERLGKFRSAYEQSSQPVRAEAQQTLDKLRQRVRKAEVAIANSQPCNVGGMTCGPQFTTMERMGPAPAAAITAAR